MIDWKAIEWYAVVVWYGSIHSNPCYEIKRNKEPGANYSLWCNFIAGDGLLGRFDGFEEAKEAAEVHFKEKRQEYFPWWRA